MSHVLVAKMSTEFLAGCAHGLAELPETNDIFLGDVLGFKVDLLLVVYPLSIRIS
jgi:hypothetical protein